MLPAIVTPLHRISLAALALVASLTFAAPAAANTYSVSNTNDVVAADPAAGCATPLGSAAGGACTLRSAVQAANQAGGTNTITLAAGTYTLTIPPTGSDDDTTGDLNVSGSDNLTITGPGASGTIVDANTVDRAFEVDSSAALTLNGVTVEDGRPGEIGNVSTCPNTSPGEADGGAILADGALTLTGVVITGNLAPGPGGAIADEDGSALNISSSTISNNVTCDNTGGFTDGGAIMEDGGGSMTIDSSTIADNVAPEDNSSGGALAEEGGADVTITNSTLSGNQAASGGAIAGYGSEEPGTITLTADTVSANNAVSNVPQGGGSVRRAPSRHALPANQPNPDTFSPGGGLLADGDDFNVTNSTIAGNAATDGGGVLDEFGNVSLSFSTVTDNTAIGSPNFPGEGTGNLEVLEDDGISLDDSIVARGVSPSGDSTNCNGFGFTDNGNNLFDDTADSGAQCGSSAGLGDVITASPGVATLAENGGPTETEALETGSPAIDAGSDALCTSETAGVDQRGVTRPQGPHCDIGAFEYEQADMQLTAVGNPTTFYPGQQSTVTDTVTNLGYSTATNVTFTDPASGAFTIDSVTPSQGTCTNTATSVSCQLGTMAVNAQVTITIVLTGNATGPITLTSSVASALPDPNLANNTATVNLDVVAPGTPEADLALTATPNPATIGQGQQSTVTDTITNNGPGTPSVTFSDPVAGSTVDSATPSQGTCTHTTNSVSCSLGTLAPGGQITIAIVVTGTSPGTTTLNSLVSGSLPDPNLANNAATATITVVPAATDLAVRKTVAPATVAAGGKATFTMTVVNHGPTDDANVVLTDTLPSGLRWTATRTSQGTCSGHRAVTCALGSLAVGAAATVKVTVRVLHGGDIRNTAHVTGAVADTNLANNTSRVAVCAENLTFTTNWQPGNHIGTVTINVDGHLTRTLHGANLRRVTLRPLSRHGTHSVTVSFIITPFDTVTATRRYHACASSRTVYAYPPQTNPGAS